MEEATSASFNRPPKASACSSRYAENATQPRGRLGLAVKRRRLPATLKTDFTPPSCEALTPITEHSTSFFSALQQLRQLPLDVRTITLGINVADCHDRSLHVLCESLYQRIVTKGAKLAAVCGEVSSLFGVPILQRRLCVTPIDRVAQGKNADDFVNIARTLDGAAANLHIDRIGGFAADVQHGMTSSSKQLIASLPAALSQTERVRAAVHVGTTESGVNMEAISLLAHTLLATSAATAHRNGDASAKLAILANDSTGHPHLTGACLGDGWGDLVVHVGVGAAAIIQHALQQQRRENPNAPLHELAATIQTAAFQATRTAELVGREVATRLGADFGSVDVTLAPTLRPHDSVVDLLPLMGIDRVGAPGTATALVLLLNAIRAGSAFASCAAGAYSRIMLSVLEDAGLSEATQSGTLTFDQLCMAANAGSSGLDLICLAGDTDAATLAAIISDQVSFAVLNRRPCAVRLIPVPGKQAGDAVSYSGMKNDAVILPVRGAGLATKFIERGGRLPPVR